MLLFIIIYIYGGFVIGHFQARSFMNISYTEIIGEAIIMIGEVDPKVRISHARNMIIHEYYTVTPDVIWPILTKYIPILESEVKELLKMCSVNGIF